ncbi:response regulator transcription factor [Flavimaricola marinus]|uniref:Oxygen regulatory protein NreC n=1 Tax=Flavimaricola marinus TaxID=1819565 RepID=A0A238LDF4_9RHOB|nr:response regulator transcription factor [Flavimaricola marinus]SMY07658.1 Oxygen regulatory protein NreC [Flavimaricola marinus]
MKILIADDHELVRDTLAMFLENEADMSVDASPDLGDACNQIAKNGPYDLVLLDYAMPGMDGLTGLTKAIDASAGKPVAVMSGSAPRAIAQEALDAGAIGFLPKTMGAKSLVNAVRFMVAGETYVPVKFMTEEVVEDVNPLAKGLSSRELEVLGGLCRGLANKEIARELDLQEVTVKLHVKTLSRKLEAKNRTHAAMIAKEAGLF